MYPDDDVVSWEETIPDPSWDDWESRVVARLDLEAAILELPLKQRLAVEKRLRDEPMSASERKSLQRAKEWLRFVL